MFSTPSSLRKRTGKLDVDRPTYLKQLVAEYECVETSDEHKEQVLANLANFAYDPINYEYFRRFGVLNLFIQELQHTISQSIRTLNKKRIMFITGAVCNVCLDVKNQEYLFRSNIQNLLLKCLSIVCHNELEHLESILNILTCFIFIYNTNRDRSMFVQYADERMNFMTLLNKFKESHNKRLSNLAHVFIEDCLNNKS